MAREINLVPDVKGEMIKALKIRNYTFFISIVVAIASVAVVAIFFVISTSQQAVVNGKKTTLDNLSAKIANYEDLSKYLTVKDQLGNLTAIANNKKLLSRTFGVLSALLPTNGDTITISELNINLSSTEPTISFDAQANANQPPYIDYNVLDSFKKSMQYMRYDYGNYVDKNGNTIPAYCIIESGNDGATFSDAERGNYAYWLITGEGCNPSYEPLEVTNSEDEDDEEAAKADEALSEAEVYRRTEGYTTETYDDQTVVKIWRTPQFSDWYKTEEVEGEPYMNLSGAISGVEHFESECIRYSGVENPNTSAVSWSSTNESCYLVPDGSDGIRITDSSNGRDSSDELVLRFSATITLTPEVYKFSNHHVLSFGPSGRYNVTDSYVQIQDMFTQRASDCDPNDTSCNDSKNRGGN